MSDPTPYAARAMGHALRNFERAEQALQVAAVDVTADDATLSLLAGNVLRAAAAWRRAQAVGETEARGWTRVQRDAR